MDIRTIKTKRAIKDAFLQLRAKKEIEKITIKELCRIAEINKSTFYSHYDDIYALSADLEKETVGFVLSSISQNEEYSSQNPDTFAREICLACISHMSLTDLMFSGWDSSRFANSLEEGIKEMIYMKYPEYREDKEKNILLSFCIQGAHHAYVNNQSVDTETLIEVIGKIIKTLQPLY